LNINDIEIIGNTTDNPELLEVELWKHIAKIAKNL
jgi:hypothetical protein